MSSSLPEVIDAHVHLFPDRVFDALFRWFESHAWPIRYKLYSPDVLAFLFSRGVSKVVALHYAHRHGMARTLNRYIANIAQADPRVVGLATVMPGEPNARDILREAFAMGLSGVKLHCHVQCFSADSAVMDEIYDACERAEKPLVMHAGREPKSSAYHCDPHELCSADRVERVLRNFPKLKLCVPHLGADEFEAYEWLLGRYDNLWLDTTMAVAGYFDGPTPTRLLECRPDRIVFGTDFPNLPYAWDRELVRLSRTIRSPDALEGIVGKNARGLFSF